MACLRVADADTIQQNGYLLIVAAPNAHVGLRTYGPALSDVYANGVFEQVIDTLYWGGLDILSLQYSNHSHRLALGHRRPRPSDAHLVEDHLFVCLV